MYSRARAFLPILVISAVLGLAGCESSEDRAERYYQSGLTLLAAGDVDRALVEFRNVFKYNGFHKEARKIYADTQLARGETGEAYSQYLRLIEQYPDTPEVRLTLAEIAIQRGDWDEAERHGRAALALTPDDPAVQAVGAALDYRKAVLAKDDAAGAKAADAARAILVTLPDNKIARRIVIDRLMASSDPQSAMPEIETALATDPGSLDLQVLKFRLLAMKNDIAGTGVQLKSMSELFPDNEEVRTALIGWYLAQGDTDGAEGFLRQLAGAPTGEIEPHVTLVQLLQRARGPEAARAELDALIAANAGTPKADTYGALRAALDFEGGRQAEAIAALEEILRTAQPSDDTRKIKVALAQMLASTSNSVGARARVEEILAEDPTNVEALKLRAAWLIDEDKPGEAIVDLRTALGQNPRDPVILTLMAQAHERDGSPELAGERLAAAVEVSGSAPEESLRYAEFLSKSGRAGAALAVLVEARRVNPNNLAVLTALTERYLAESDWDRASEVVTALRGLETPEATAVAQKAQAALMLGQNRTEDTIAFLEGLIVQGSGDTATVAMVVQTQLRAGKPAEARAYLDEQLAKTPRDTGLRMLSASLHAAAGDTASAETILRELVAEDPKAEPPARLLYGLLASGGRAAEATAVLDAALAAQPDAAGLAWIKAGELESAGDIDGAIAVYEALYAKNSSNPVVANNLASLITAHRDDPASLERGFAIARRLRGLDVPAFQDTYGWIEFRRGNLSEALANLEPAAKGLPDDPLAQFHLGMTYAALKRPEEAAAALRRALEIAGDSPLPQFQTARETLASLGAAEPAGETPAPADGDAPASTAP